ncbi:cytochrome P450-dit2 [Ceratobasidium sp. 392]|nr:cytochrome P450-dit2 [Ceratobasidium sp. 392]
MHDMFGTPASEVPAAGWFAFGACIALALYRFNRGRKLLVNLPGPPAPHWTTGHFKAIFGFNAIPYYQYLASNYGPTAKVNGAFGGEFIWTFDPAAMHSILVKDRVNFERPTGNILFIRSVMGGGLLGLTGDEHRIHRKILNPVFTMRFLRERVVMPIFMNIAEQTCEAIEKDVNSSQEDINVFPWMAAAALELVGEAGLGYSFESFSGKRNEYSIAIKKIVRFFGKVVPFSELLPYIYNVGTPRFRRWVLEHIPISSVQQLLQATDLQSNQAEEVLRARQVLLASGGDLTSEAGRGRDIMTLLMKANESEGSENHISHDAMIGHMNIFIFAGHETTSTAVSRILSILANNEQIQVKLREEIRSYFQEHQDDTNHDALLELPYLDAVVRETLRVHGPATNLIRESQVDTVIPLEYPVDTPTGKITSIPIKKGTRVLMNVVMANRYDMIWGERADEFWPERWIGTKLDEVTEPGSHLPGVYSSMMSFGGGPTSCIGFKFAVLEIKVMVATLVKTFKFEPSVRESVWETLGIQFPYLKSEMDNPDKLPKLPLRVTKM